MKDLLALFALLYVLPAFAQTVAPYNPDADGNGIVGAADLLPFLEFFGMPFEPEEINCPSTCGDSILFAGQYYGTAPMASLCWFTENLRAETYINGDSIVENNIHSDWYSVTTGLRTVYGAGDTPCLNTPPNFDACDEDASLALYGRLYNGHTVVDPRGICPTGWHVPTNGNYQEVIDFYSPNEGDGEALKATSGWSTEDPVFGPGTNGTNVLGYDGRPGGALRTQNPEFYYAGLTGHWWTSTVSADNPDKLYVRYLEHNHPSTMAFSDYGKQSGYSVRCVKALE